MEGVSQAGFKHPFRSMSATGPFRATPLCIGFTQDERMEEGVRRKTFQPGLQLASRRLVGFEDDKPYARLQLAELRDRGDAAT